MANQTSESETETELAADVSTPDADASESPAEDAERETAESQEDSLVEPNESESEQSSRRRILIGSERDAANKQLAPAKPKAVREAEKPLELPPVTISTPQDVVESTGQEDTADQENTKVEFLSTTSAVPAPPASEPSEVVEIPEVDMPNVTINPPAMGDLEQELQAALGEVSMDELLAQDETAGTDDELAEDSRHKATVVKVHEDNVFFTLGGRHEGVASVRQFKKPPKPGSMMDVVVRGVNADDGLYELAIPGASVSVADWHDLAEGAVVETRITGANTGGLECMVNTIRGFIPASQIALHHVDNLNDYINQKLQCVVMECKPRRRKLVLSHRAILEREQEESRKKVLETIEAGQTLEGTVSSLRDFGAFVDLGGVDGLIHISKMSWDRVDHPKEVLEEGQKVRVKVEKVNTQTGKIALSYRDLLEHPWDRVEEKYPVNGIVSGPVSRVANFGAFVKLEPGIEGLIHISELAHHRVIAVTNVVKEGEEVQCKILSVDRESQRIALSLKAMQNAPEPKKKEEATQDDEPPRELAVKRRKGPLKGGRDKPTGGEAFGLKW